MARISDAIGYDVEVSEPNGPTVHGYITDRWANSRQPLPVKPGREAVIEAMLGSDIITDDLRAEASAQGSTQREPFLCFADAVLDLWPGESRATAQAEALREFAARVRDEMDDSDKVLGTKWATDEYRHGMRSALMQVDEEADRLAAEGGDGRG